MNPTNKTIIIDDAVPFAEAIFSHLGNIITMPGKEIGPEDLKNADALIIRSRTNINAELLEGSKVEFVGSTVVGLDHVDQTYLTDNNIHFYSAQGCNANSVAEFIITALFDMAEKFDFDLTGKTLGIIGVGNVGQRVYDKAKALGIKCLLNDPPKLAKQPGLVNDNNYVDLDTCLTADIITVHTPLTFEGEYSTYNLISAEKLARLQPSQILINAARGGIINEKSWIETATKANIIDCWESEPNIDAELYDKALIATPHIAGHSLDAKIAGSFMVYEALCSYWNTPMKNDWRKALPEQPEKIVLTETNNIQKALNTLFNITHDIYQDDLAIRDKQIEKVHNKYENYRRNFPVYREWKQHQVKQSDNQKLNNLLINLGFTVD